jgi:hypothetical protein
VGSTVGGKSKKYKHAKKPHVSWRAALKKADGGTGTLVDPLSLPFTSAPELVAHLLGK